MNQETLTLLDNIDKIHKRKQNIEQLIKLLQQSKPYVPTPIISYKPPSHINLPPGLANLGATCFHNAATQLFYRMDELLSYVTRDDIYNQYTINSPFKYYIELLQIMKTNADNDEPVVSHDELQILVATQICNVLPDKYVQGQQEDASEFLEGILNDMNFNGQKDKNLPTTDPRTFLSIIYETYKCELDVKFSGDPFIKLYKKIYSERWNDATEEQKKDPKWGQLTLDPNKYNQYVQQYQNYLTDSSTKCRPWIKGKTIPDWMLRLSFNENTDKGIEEIIGENINYDNDITERFFASDVTSNGPVQYQLYAKKTNYIPNKYLIIQLRVFSREGTITKKKGHNIKLANNNDEFIFKYKENGVQKEKTYELVGTVNHEGTLTVGHYWAYIKYNNQWYEYNDTRRDKIDRPTDYRKAYLALYIQSIKN